MSQIFPYMNPLRFQEASESIDYINTYPTFDLMKPRQKYQRALNAISVYPDFLLNTFISIEIYTTTSAGMVTPIILFPDGTSDQMDADDITPSGYSGDNIILISYNSNQTGAHYITLSINEGNFQSHDFINKSGSDLKDTVRVQFYDTLNRNGGYFYDETSLMWNPYVCYTGVLKKGATQFERSLYNDQPNNTTVLRATPKLQDTLIITDIHHTYYDNICHQFSCDTVFVNGIQYATEEIGEPEYVAEDGDVINVTITLSRNTNNSFQQIS